MPTAAELGYPGMMMTEWYGFFPRAGTRVQTIAAWNNELKATLTDREVAAQLEQLGVTVDPSTPQQCTTRLAAHIARRREILESFGVLPSN